MKNAMRRIGLAVVFLAATTWTPAAWAGLAQVQAGVSGSYNALAGSPELGYSGAISSGPIPGSTDVTVVQVSGDAYAHISASAGVSLLRGDTGISLSTVNNVFETINRDAQAGSFAGAEWLDLIHVANVTPPSELEMTVHVRGSFGFSPSLNFPGAGASGSVGLANLTNLTSLVSGVDRIPFSDYYPFNPSSYSFRATSVGHGHDPSTIDLEYGPGSNVENARTFVTALDGVNLEWDAKFILPFNESLHGYVLNLYATAQSGAYYPGYASTLFGETIKVSSVTQTDGTPVEGLSFESGFAIAAVPEPSTLISGGIAAMASIGYAVRRRKAKLVA